MVQFAFFKEIFFGIGDFFTWTFQVLPPIGYITNWILTIVGSVMLIYWCAKIVSFGKDDKSMTK